MQKEKFQSKIDSFGIMKSAWLTKQVEGHLFFGSIYQYVPFLFLGGVASILFYLWIVLNRESGLSISAIGNMVGGVLMGGAMIYVSFYFSKYQQAVIGWFSIKIAMGIAAFLFMTVGTFSSLSKHQADALIFFLLGLVWLPWIEFIPVVAKYQRLVTILRLFLTVPLVLLGIQSGNWSWV